MKNDKDWLNNLFSDYTGKDDKHGYHCNKCDYEMEMIVVKTALDTPRKMFFCKNNRCKRFGIVVVVAKIKNKI